MIDIARIFAFHGAKSTITTPKHALSFQNSIKRDQESGLPITITTLQLPNNVEDIANTDMSASPLTDTSMLEGTLKSLLLEKRPDCIVHDVFHRWSASAINSVDIPRIVFNGNGCFARCVQENMGKFKPHEKVGSDYEPFVVPGLPDLVELTRSQLPKFARQGGHPHGKMMRKPDDERGQKTAIDEQHILSFLNSKEPNSILYISFGSLAQLAPSQLLEIAHGLEASNKPFIWVVGKIFKNENENEENWFPIGFEDRIRESKKGLIIRGWAPQLLILEHAAVGGFMTHCGWNSTLEGVCAAVPMITWPITAEQFSNEKLVADVLKIGVKVGSMDWMGWSDEPWAAVGRDKVGE
ncbi:hypothetical protein LWI28_012110 [Acer negundo]|uniref:Uncharacterized protein n=1 Tax=Acer negundo TaxID=4023 RepID=A0AAD5IYT4_ACENE|nr:hypothetical protein LWI28_012110 [Acer negundo]